jgi:signal transduction histidine kinase/ActR/RegA family two-component response regulator
MSSKTRQAGSFSGALIVVLLALGPAAAAHAADAADLASAIDWRLVLGRTWIPLVALLSALVVSLGWAQALRREVRRRRVAETRLIQAKERAERLARVKQDFLTVAAHEVRAPVNAITASVNRLSQLVRDPVQRELVRMTRRSVDALAEFVSNVLDLSKDEAGKLTLDPQPDDLAALVREVTAGFAPFAAEQGNALSFHQQGAIPGCLLFDAMRVRQIVTNLVSNAIKFTEGGRIMVTVTGQARTDGARNLCCEVRITVSDDGIGITPEQQRRLFEPYAQFATGNASRFGGIGLGLAICKRLAEAMGGSIELASEWRRGTSATVRLALRNCEIEDAQGSGERQRPRVLIADNDPVQQIVLTTTLRQIGIDPDVADDADQALDRWRERRHDLILAGCDVSGADRLAMARRLVEEGGPAVRVVGVSEEADMFTGAIGAGIMAMLQKPVSAAQLRHAIAEAMGDRPHPAIAHVAMTIL